MSHDGFTLRPDSIGDEPSCPFCARYRFAGHTETCPVGERDAALKRLRVLERRLRPSASSIDVRLTALEARAARSALTMAAETHEESAADAYQSRRGRDREYAREEARLGAACRRAFGKVLAASRGVQ